MSVPKHWLLPMANDTLGDYSGQIVHQQKYRPGDSNKEINFSSNDECFFFGITFIRCDQGNNIWKPKDSTYFINVYNHDHHNTILHFLDVKYSTYNVET